MKYHPKPQIRANRSHLTGSDHLIDNQAAIKLQSICILCTHHTHTPHWTTEFCSGSAPTSKAQYCPSQVPCQLAVVGVVKTGHVQGISVSLLTCHLSDKGLAKVNTIQRI